MENNEMNYEVTELVPAEEEEVMTESSGIGTGLAMIIGGVLTAGAIAGGKKLKKVWANHKAKKELKQTAKKAEAQGFEDSDVESEDSAE